MPPPAGTPFHRDHVNLHGAVTALIALALVTLGALGAWLSLAGTVMLIALAEMYLQRLLSNRRSEPF